MKRLINVTIEVNWKNYDDVCDKYILENSGIYNSLKSGVEIITETKQEEEQS